MTPKQLSKMLRRIKKPARGLWLQLDERTGEHKEVVFLSDVEKELLKNNKGGL